MRSPVIAFSLLAAAVSPTLVSGAPASPQLNNAIAHTENAASMAHVVRTIPAVPAPLDAVVGAAPTPPKAADRTDDPVHRTEAMRQAKAQAQQGQGSVKAAAVPAVAHKAKRAGDQNTAGGNAYSGAASESSGGDVVNEADRGTLSNAAGSNPGGGGGSSFSGFAYGGNGEGHGPGGNAYTGATGASRGGSVVNIQQNTGDNGDAATMTNTNANNAGGGGFSESGSAEGGNAAGPQVPSDIRRRAGDNGTAGGNAYSGATSNVSGGNTVNAADQDGTLNNDGGNAAGGAGTTFSGDADGGNGNGRGPGGNAYSGASGPATGGFVYNSAGTINNAADTAAPNTGGGGGVSQTGDANGGRA